MTLKIAIIGRPNVGKSTLFNRLVGKKLALVDDTPGVTRDRREGDGRIGDIRFTIVDTAGLEEAKGERLEARMREQTDLAIGEADICLMVIDGRAGVMPLDKHFASLLRTQEKPVILLVNKCEGAAGDEGFYGSWELGLGEPIALSAEHGEGLGELYEALRPHADERDLADARADEDEDGDEDGEGAEGRFLRMAIVGRPNVGKSTLVNTLIGQDRMLTGPEAGITRDSVSVEWQWQDQRVKIFDTAGMRRKAKVNEKLEKLSVADSLRAIRFAEVVVLLVDATMPLEKQDVQIADLVISEGRSLVIGVNKWDLIEDREECLRDIRDRVEIVLPQIKGVEIVTFSGLTGRGIDRIMPAVQKTHTCWNKRISTARLNSWLEGAIARHPPPSVAGRRVSIRYMTQVKSRPPTFALFSTRADVLSDSYQRYLVNGLREAFDIPGVPIRLLMRKQKNPYASKR